MLAKLYNLLYMFLKTWAPFQNHFLYFPQHEEEPPQNMKPQPGNEKPLSKTALKNQRKHEAKKAAKQVLGTLIASKPKQTKPAKLAHALKLKSCSPKTLTVRL